MSQVPSTTPKTRLGEQMFSFTLVLQLVPLAAEIIVPFAIRYVTEWFASRSGESTPATIQERSKKVNSEEKQLVETVLYEASLPPHRFFGQRLRRPRDMEAY